MSNVRVINADWHTGTLRTDGSPQLAYQGDHLSNLVVFNNAPQLPNYYLLVEMKTDDVGTVESQPAILLEGPYWLIPNYYTQFAQMITFQICSRTEVGDFENHSAKFTGTILPSLKHDGEPIDSSSIFDLYQHWVTESAMAAGAIVIDKTLSADGAAADAKAAGTVLKSHSSAISELDGRVDALESGAPSGPTYDTYFDGTITVTDTVISIPSLSDLIFAEGDVWRVTWDRHEYICVAAIMQGWMGAIGNLNIVDGTGIPFLLYNYGGGALNGNSYQEGDHTLKLELQTSSGSDGGTSDITLSGKFLAMTGDSIAAGAGNNGIGYGELITTANSMALQNIAVGGGTVSSNQGVFCICTSIDNLPTNADYVLLEGGGNDSWGEVPLGTLSNGYDATLDITTFAGAMEYMLKSAISRFPNKKIGYILIHKCAALYDSSVPNSYYDMAISACKKWGIPYLDLNTQIPPLGYIDALRTAYTANADGTHPNEQGYNAFYVPKITAWLKTL